MTERVTIEGRVAGSNALRHGGRKVHCWETSVQAAVAPRPLDLSSQRGQAVRVSGVLLDDLWEAALESVEAEDAYTEIRGRVVGFSTIDGPDGRVECYRHGVTEAAYRPLNLSDYHGRKITVAGRLQGGALYHAEITQTPGPALERPADREARSLEDLLRIRATNRQRIEAVNGNLGTALGVKWSNGESTGRPCVIVFVPQKVAPALVPPSERVPPLLETKDGQWCLTDVVTGGKKASLDDIDPLPPLSPQNQQVVAELRSGRIGLVGGMQLAFFGGGDPESPFVGTAGIAVRQPRSGHVGFLTNQHVADAPGRIMYHPQHGRFPIGVTERVQELARDESWYDGIIDERNSYVRCDFGLVRIPAALESLVRPGVHAIGRTGSVLPIDMKSMQIIGRKVIGVGRTRGIQRGTIVGYAYEFRDDFFSVYTDLLIIGEEGGAFSWKGDSGKVIVTDDDERRPVALLWGGWQERLRQGREQELWSYAIDLGKVLRRLDVSPLS